MKEDHIAIKVEQVSKCYRIGLKEELHDTFAQTLGSFIKKPIRNFKKYRSLYTFDDIAKNPENQSSDVFWAVKNVSFEAKKGEIIGLIGLNGAGKSTLLKILSQITPPTEGRVTFRGKVSSLLEVGTGFHPELTGRENIYLNGTILGMRKKLIDQRLDEIIDFSGVEKFLDTPVKRYSSGMRMRLAFAVSAHLEPEILLVDEVLAVGDARFQKKCLNKMKDVSQHGRTVLFVSHNMPAVTRLCPRTILLGDGQVLADGPSAEVVGVYMNSDKGGMTAQRSWPNLSEAPGDEVIRLCSVRAKNVAGEIAGIVNIRDSVCIELEYEVLHVGYEWQIYFHLINDAGIKIFQSIEDDPFWRKKIRPIGRYVSKAWIPGDLLTEGMYYINPRIYTTNPWLARVSINDVIGIQIIDEMDGSGARGDAVGHIKGVIRPHLKWETKLSPLETNEGGPIPEEIMNVGMLAPALNKDQEEE